MLTTVVSVGPHKLPMAQKSPHTSDDVEHSSPATKAQFICYLVSVLRASHDCRGIGIVDLQQRRRCCDGGRPELLCCKSCGESPRRPRTSTPRGAVRSWIRNVSRESVAQSSAIRDIPVRDLPTLWRVRCIRCDRGVADVPTNNSGSLNRVASPRRIPCIRIRISKMYFREHCVGKNMAAHGKPRALMCSDETAGRVCSRIPPSRLQTWRVSLGLCYAAARCIALQYY